MVDTISLFSVLFFIVMVIIAVYGYHHPNAWHKKRNPFKDHNSSLRQADSLSGVEFEHWCADLLKYNGFTNIAVTKASGDQGADIIAFRNGVKYAIQCKRFKNKLGNKPVQEVYAAKAHYTCTRAAVMTTNYFTEGAIDLARSTGVELWDRSVLSRMIDEKNKCLNQQVRDYQQRQEQAHNPYQPHSKTGTVSFGSSKTIMTVLQVLGAVAVIGVLVGTAYFLSDEPTQKKFFQGKPSWSSSPSYKTARNNPTSNMAVIPPNLVYDGSTQAELDRFAEEYGLISVVREDDNSLTLTADTNIMHANVDALVAMLSKKCGGSGYMHFVSISVNEDHNVFTIVVNDVNMSEEEKQAVTDCFLMAGLEAVQTKHNIHNICVKTENKLGIIINTRTTNQ